MITPYKVQIRYADLDTMGHVNNAVYFSYFEMARVHYFHQILAKAWDTKKNGVLVVRNEINYLAPVHLYDQPEIEVLIDTIGEKSITLAYEVKVNGKLTTTGKSVLVSFDVANQQSIAVPEEWKKSFASLRSTERK